mmetsp:Transcript_31246/g.91802  ORF Transcript_31246/g.91802 Transcript_31246/m.91802 type:complete len:235 (-) Transcript_31246:397-1101(-)
MQDPRWDVIQRELSPAAAQRVICQGVSARCTRLLYAAMRARSSALRGLQSWRVATACTGGDLMLSGLDAAGIQYRVVQASELKSTTVGRASRKVINALYEGDGFRLFDDACSEDAIGGAASDLFAMGFPCTKFSALNRQCSEEEVREALKQLRLMLRYINRHRPAGVLLENVAGLLRPQMQHALAGICERTYVIRAVHAGVPKTVGRTPPMGGRGAGAKDACARRSARRACSAA